MHWGSPCIQWIWKEAVFSEPNGKVCTWKCTMTCSACCVQKAHCMHMMHCMSMMQHCLLGCCTCCMVNNINAEWWLSRKSMQSPCSHVCKTTKYTWVKCCYEVVVMWGPGDTSVYFVGKKEKDFLLKSLRPKYNVAAFAVPLHYTAHAGVSSQK